MPSEKDSKRFYWLKLEKDFFKRHDIRIVEAMPNGKDYIIFYLKLLCESTSHEGYLRFSETIPYNEEKDAARYADEPGLDAVIGNGYFVVVWPDDAHEPLLAVDGKPELVKKVVLKVPVL